MHDVTINGTRYVEEQAPDEATAKLIQEIDGGRRRFNDLVRLLIELKGHYDGQYLTARGHELFEARVGGALMETSEHAVRHWSAERAVIRAAELMLETGETQEESEARLAQALDALHDIERS